MTDEVLLRRALITNSFVAVTVRVVTMCAALFTTPWLIGALGVPGFGVYSALISVTAFAAFVDAGLAVTVRTSVAEALGRDEVNAAREAVESGVVLLAGVALALAGTFAASLAVLPWRAWLGAPGAGGSAAVTALAVYVGLYLLAVPLLPAQRALEAVGKTPLVTALALVPSAILLAGAFALRQGPRSVLPFGVVAGVCPLAVGLGGVALLRLRARDIVPRRFAIRPDVLRFLWRGSWPMVVVSVALSLSYSLDPILIGAVHGPGHTAEYALAAKIVQVTNLVFVSSVPVLWTYFAKRRGRGEQSGREVRRLSIVYTAASTVIGASLVLVGPRLTGLWSDGSVESPRALFVALAAWSVVLAGHLPAAMLLTDHDSLRFQARTTSVMAACNVGLSLVLVRTIGPTGPVWASAAALAACHATPVIWRARRMSATTP